jgi:virginiamycin A acetyltransferase
MHVVTVTRSLLDFLRAHRVFLNPKGLDRWEVGQPVGVADDCEIEPYAQIFGGIIIPAGVGAFSYSHSDFGVHVRVGRYCSIGSNVGWLGPDHPTTWISTSSALYDRDLAALRAYRADSGDDYTVQTYVPKDRSVTIGHDVWIGDQALIASGVTIGHGAIVGARSLVMKDVPPYAIVFGQPAQIQRYRLPEALIGRFLELEWWRYAPNVLNTLPVTEPERFADCLAKVGSRAMQPKPLTSAAIIAAARAP